jgi:hypothetical protein
VKWILGFPVFMADERKISAYDVTAALQQVRASAKTYGSNAYFATREQNWKKGELVLYFDYDPASTSRTLTVGSLANARWKAKLEQRTNEMRWVNVGSSRTVMGDLFDRLVKALGL